MENEKHVLIILPHPDDESFGTGGSITDYVGRGVPVTYACMTLGEMGRNLGNPPFASRESLHEFRSKELDDAANLLGIDVIKMGYRDKTVEFLDEDLVAKHVLQIVKEVQPSLVISFYPDYAVHPDHDACGRIVIKALEQMPKAERPKLQKIAFAKDTEKHLGPADIIFDIRPFAQDKLAAIRAHRSQTESMTINWDTMFDHPDNKVNVRFMAERFYIHHFKD